MMVAFALLIQPGTSGSFCYVQISGFTAASAAREKQIEDNFKTIPEPGEEGRQYRVFTSELHTAASRRNNYLAHYIVEEWRKQA